MNSSSAHTKRRSILGMEIDQLPPEIILSKIIRWSEKLESEGRSHYVCVSNVHQCMECFDDQSLKMIVNGADIVMTDSQILTWFQKFLGFDSPYSAMRSQHFTERLCELAAEADIKIGFYGGTEESLPILTRKLNEKYPNLTISFAASPPFRSVTEAEDQQYIRRINDSGAKILFLGIGCPKQERWMGDHADQLSTVMIGVGAAFDFISGTKRQPPTWVHRMGLEWLFRLCTEPRRLGKRHLYHNPRFIFHSILQKFGKLYQ